MNELDALNGIAMLLLAIFFALLSIGGAIRKLAGELNAQKGGDSNG